MNAFFLTIVNMSISASWIVLAVLILRLLLKKAPKWIAVLLWGIVAVRLICPISIESVLSLIPSKETINPDILVEQAPVINPSIPVFDGEENPNIIGGGSPVIGDNLVIGDNPVTGEPSAPTVDTSVNPLQIAITVSSYVWLAGIAGMLAYTVISYFRVKAKIGTAVRLRDNIFQSESVVSPFVLGVIKPKIYLPFCMDGQDMEYVIAHENAHIRRKDHWWKPIGFLILTLHWFNPLLWLGYVLLCRDIELACDEKVVKTLDFQQKADYSQALLNCSVNRRIIAACPLAFGEVGIKERVKSVLSYKKPAFWIIVVAIVASIITAVCFLTDPLKEEESTEQFFSEGYLFFDIGAESMESIRSCTIIHDGNPAELILSEEDTLLFARYAYTDKVPVQELSEVLLYPKNKRIQIAVGERNVLLYLTQDGRIAVNLPEKGFCMYQAEEQDVITPAKYEQLVAKYTTEPNTPNQSTAYDRAIAAYYAFLNGQIAAIAEDNSKIFVSSYSSISNGQSGFDRYALHDVNGDGIPELFIDASHDHILAFDGENVRQWYSSMSWMGIQLLSSGAVVDTHSGAGSFINYLTFGPDGIEKFISFSGGPGGESGPYYYGEGKSEPSKEVSKDQWEALTKPYFQQMENKAELEWHTTIPTTPNNGAQVYPTITFRVNSSRPEYTAVVNYSNGSAVTAQSITITDRAAKKDIQTINVSGNELFAEMVLYAADITFDGNLDILIPYERPASAAYFQAYVWQESEGQFVYAPQFENLPNFVIDKENNRILSTRTASQITSYGISYYDAEAKDFRPSHSIYWEPDASDSKMHFVEQHDINGVTVIVKDCQVEKSSHLDVNKADPQIAEYFAAGSFWDLDSQKWKNQFYKLSQNGTTEGTEDPYPIQEITDVRVIAGENHQTYRDSYISLNFPLGWKCLEQWGEDGLFVYFQDPVLGENCRLSIYFSNPIYARDRTREGYMALFTGAYGYEDVVIDSFTKETIQGFPCTKIVFSYTEDNTKFIGIWYDSLIEGPRLYIFRIRFPAEESKTYEKEFAAIMNSVRFLLTDKVDISTLPLDEAYAHAVKQYQENPGKHRDICDLQPETGQIIEIDGKYYQSFVSSNVDIRYIWISRSEFPDNRQSLWDWYPVGSSRVYSLDLLGKIDEGRKGGETDQIDPADMLLLSVLYNNQSFYCYEGPYSENVKHTISDYHRDIWKFTVVDMDGDRKNELAVQFFEGDILLLRQDNGVVYGDLFGMRGMYRIFKNGTFLWNSDAGSINGCSKLRFTEEGAKTIELWRVERDDSGGVTYYVDDKQVTEAEWNAMMQQDNSEEEVWFTYSG